MKIAVFHNLPSGGAKRALYGFVKRLTKLGNTVDILVPSTANETFLPLKGFARKFEVFPVKKTFAGLITSALFYFPSLRYSLADIDKTESDIASTINERDYDVVLSEQDRYVMSPFLLKYIRKPAKEVNTALETMEEAEMIVMLQGKEEGVKKQPLYIRCIMD